MLVGFIARGVLLRKFDQIMLDEAFRRYQGDIVAYVGQHGSWDKAAKAEPFSHFQQNRARKLDQQSHHRPEPNPPNSSTGNQQPNGAPPNGNPPNGNPPNGNPPNGNPPNGNPPNDNDRGRDLLGDQGATPPFRFLLMDAQGRVLMGAQSFKIGSIASEHLRNQARAIKVKGRIVAYAVPVNEPNFSDLDLGYFSAMRQALLLGTLGAVLLATTLGLFFGNRLSANLRELTQAISKMRDGDLKQQVRVKSQNEFGVLVESFNRMSADLSQAHQELQQSHHKISEQAALLRELSLRDEMTQLPNRRHFNEQAAPLFAQSQRYQQPLTMMIGDIDHFKKINDHFSHAVGDEVLRRVSHILKSSTRSSDLVARYGGEEFVVAFAQTPLPPDLSFEHKPSGRGANQNGNPRSQNNFGGPPNGGPPNGGPPNGGPPNGGPPNGGPPRGEPPFEERR